MERQFRDLFAKHLLELKNVSKCSNPRTAIITRGELLISSGWNREAVPGLQIPPIFIAIHGYSLSAYKLYGGMNEETLNPTLFSSYFPSLNEFLLLMTTDIRSVYYMGDLEDEKAVRFLNDLTRIRPDDSFEIIKLEIF